MRSYMWQAHSLIQHIGHLNDLHSACFHHCMFGAPRKKRTKLVCNHAAYLGLTSKYDGKHPHLPWGRAGCIWATSLEEEYPLPLCRAIAQVCRHVLLDGGAHDMLAQLEHGGAASLVQASRAATGKLRPLVREYSCIVKIQGPLAALDTLLVKCDAADTAVQLPLDCTMHTPLPSLPAHSKRTKPPMNLGDGSSLAMWVSLRGTQVPLYTKHLAARILDTSWTVCTRPLWTFLPG